MADNANDIHEQIKHHADEILRLSALLIGQTAGAASAPATGELDLSTGDWMEGSIAMRRWGASEDTLERWRIANKVIAKKVVGRWYYNRKYPPITAQTSVEAYHKNSNGP